MRPPCTSGTCRGQQGRRGHRQGRQGRAGGRAASVGIRPKEHARRVSTHFAFSRTRMGGWMKAEHCPGPLPPSGPSGTSSCLQEYASNSSSHVRDGACAAVCSPRTVVAARCPHAAPARTGRRTSGSFCAPRRRTPGAQAARYLSTALLLVAAWPACFHRKHSLQAGWDPVYSS